MKVLIGLAVLVAAVAAIGPRLVERETAFRASLGYLPSSRITNGTIAGLGEFPYQVGLSLHTPERDYWCGGTLISDRWVLTAAHCTEGVNSVDVYLGYSNRSDPTEPGQQRVYVPKKYIILHEKWDTDKLLNDISLIKLPVPITFNEFIQPANLPKKTTPEDKFVGNWTIASGWGRDSDKSETISEVLRWIEINVMDNSICSRYYGNFILPTHICIRTMPDRKSICNGDSGGPLVLSGTRTVIGATSFGANLGCEIGYPGVFTRITSYLDWIKLHTGLSSE